MREIQAAAMRRRRPWWLAINAVGALVTALPARPLTPQLPWAIAILGTALLTGVIARARPHGRAAQTPMPDIIGGLAFGCAWAMALVMLDGDAVMGSLLRTQLICLLGVAATLTAPVPAAGFATIGPVAAALGVSAYAGGGVALVGEVALLAATAIVSLRLNARTLLRRMAAEQQLAEKEEVIRLLLREFEEQGSDWMWQTDAARRLINVDANLARHFGLPAEAIEGRAMIELLGGSGTDDGRGDEPIRALADKLLRRESFRDLIVPVHIGDETRWWSLSATPRRNERGTMIGFWGVATDVTERHRSAEKIDRMARFDTLTGLANRAHVMEALGDALRLGHRAGRRSTLMLIDLDRFKQVNDTLGHPIGDKLLVAVAGRLRGLTGAGETCGRLGGDEFALVVADAHDHARIDALAEQIVASLSAPYEIDGHRLRIGASVGSATAPRDGRVMETLLRNADLALYRAKDDGRGLHRRYEPQLHAAAEQRRRVEVALHEAVDRGEMTLAYQPIIETEDGRVTGFEALLRWTHPELGPIAPDAFLPIAEEMRLIGRIGAWVMHSACREAASWPASVRVAVNLGAAQLKDPQLPATIVAALSHSGLAPARLELEIAQSVFLRGGEGMIEATDRLLALGVRVTLCDHGKETTAFFRKGRFSTIKIDRGFVRGVANGEPESVAIVRGIVEFAQSLGMTTIAEGAETRRNVEQMRALGCDCVQGWTVAQPLDADDARRFAHQACGGTRAEADARQVA